jgi:hypothetical protein
VKEVASQLGTPLPRQPIVGWVWIAVCAGIAIISTANAIKGSSDWLFARVFGTATVILLFLPLALPRRRETVQLDGTGVLVAHGKRREQVQWSDMRRVTIRTNSAGPYSEDVFFVLEGSDGSGCVVTHGAAVRTKLLEAMQSHLVGVDDKKVIAAMGCTRNNTFVIWDKGNTEGTD